MFFHFFPLRSSLIRSNRWYERLAHLVDRTLKSWAWTLTWLGTEGERPVECVCACVCVLPGDDVWTREILVWSLEEREKGGQRREQQRQTARGRRTVRQHRGRRVQETESLRLEDRDEKESGRQGVRRDQASRQHSYVEGGLKIMSSLVTQWDGKKKCVQNLLYPFILTGRQLCCLSTSITFAQFRSLHPFPQ